MKKIAIISSMVLLGIGMSACSPIPRLQPGAENVVVAYKKPADNCTQVTVITSEQSQESSSVTAPQLQQGAMNELRNAALLQHANYIYVINNYSKLKNSSGGNYAENDVSAIVVRGIAYQCPNEHVLPDGE